MNEHFVRSIYYHPDLVPLQGEQAATRECGEAVKICQRQVHSMKKLIMCIAIIMIICIATAWADPAGTVSPGNSALQATTGAWGLLADTHDMVMTHETIQQRQADIRQDVQDIRGDILGNLTTGHEAVQDQRQVMRN